MVSQIERLKIHRPIFHNSKALQIVGIVSNISDYGNRFAGLRLAPAVNATKTQKYAAQRMLAAVAFRSFFRMGMQLGLQFRKLHVTYQFASKPCIP